MHKLSQDIIGQLRQSEGMIKVSGVVDHMIRDVEHDETLSPTEKTNLVTAIHERAAFERECEARDQIIKQFCAQKENERVGDHGTH